MAMNDLISRDAVIRLIQARYENPEICAQEINSIPAIDAIPVVHAKWIESNQNNSYSCRLVKCSNCGETHIVPYTIPLDEWAKNRNYCGSCGSLMDGKDDSHA